MDPLFVGMKDGARALGVSLTTFEKWVSSGEIESCAVGGTERKIGRRLIPVAALHEFAERLRNHETEVARQEISDA